MEQKLRTQILYNDLLRFLLYTNVPPQFGADEVNDGSSSLLSKMKMKSDALWATLIRLMNPLVRSCGVAENCIKNSIG
jgi:hypothetical protein